jgi:hypothetical protein
MLGREDPAPLSADCFAIACRAMDGSRKRTKLFSGFLSHYFIHDRYERPGKGNDKGAVEGLVGYAPLSRFAGKPLPGNGRNFMVPMPQFRKHPVRAVFSVDLEFRSSCSYEQQEIHPPHRSCVLRQNRVSALV